MGAPPGHALLAATWRDSGGSFAGVLAATSAGVLVVHRKAVPTRAHGIVVEPTGMLLVASRRPGDWLMRFDAEDIDARKPAARKAAATAWCWSSADYSFNGHVIASLDGHLLFSTETSRETGAGSIGVRDAATFELLTRWPTAGVDPHELVIGPDGGLWVANGGIETWPETCRIRHHLERMESSLVCLDVGSGRITGQWRLDDRRLGLRHLAFADDGTLGVALQAEHDDPEARRTAPVLAVWQPRRGLRAIPLPDGLMLSGYGGAIDAMENGFAVSCPRDDQVTRWRLAADDVSWQPPLVLTQACALSRGWCGGAGTVIHVDTDRAVPLAHWPLSAAIQLDNHWTATPAPSGFKPEP